MNYECQFCEFKSDNGPEAMAHREKRQHLLRVATSEPLAAARTHKFDQYGEAYSRYVYCSICKKDESYYLHNTKRPHKAEREAWILKYMQLSSRRWHADVLNVEFHEAYHRTFPVYKRKETNFGAQPVAQAMRDLASMAKQGILESGRVGVSNGEGFPTSVIGYTMPEIRRNRSRSMNY